MAITAAEYYNAIGGGGGATGCVAVPSGNQYNWLTDQMMSRQDQMNQAAAHNEYLQRLQNRTTETTITKNPAAPSLLLLLEE